MEATSSPAAAGRSWRWPLDPAAYDRDANLGTAERSALEWVLKLRARRTGAGRWPRQIHTDLSRLLTPINQTLDLIGVLKQDRFATVGRLLEEMHQRRGSFWGWDRDEWTAVLRDTHASIRQYVMAVGYLLCGFSDLHHAFPAFKRYTFAVRLFGKTPVDSAIKQVAQTLLEWGFGKSLADRYLPRGLAEVLLLNRSPQLEDITAESIEAVLQSNPSGNLRKHLLLVERALSGKGMALRPSAASPAPDLPIGTPAVLGEIAAEWVGWVKRWYVTSTLAPKTRKTIYYHLLKAGRWLAKTHPETVGPAQWDREMAADYVGAVDRWRVGDWAYAPATHRYASRVGKPLAACAKDQNLGSIRRFFSDCQEWEWLPRRFDPVRSFRTPRSIRALLGPNPRVIADDVWAKLVWAGLNLIADDLPKGRVWNRSWYPVEMARAVATVWLFSGLRLDEIVRLRVGCVRWRSGAVAPGEQEASSQEAICWLDVPTNKTGTSFTKPVDRLVGEAIAVWEKVRPVQPSQVDPKTAEVVHFLFAYRGQRLSKAFVNRTLIPYLCRKAGVPEQDARGRFTSHRARSTIATQLYNAKEPMSLFELQEWLGHRSPASTQHYAKLTPTKLARAFEDAGYFGRNLRLIEVLIDQEAVKTGAAAKGEPWRFYDLGHGYCTYDFFDQCPHRMACAKCAFYAPKDSTKAHLLEGKSNLQRLRQEIPLTEEEQAAVEDGLAAYEKLLADLADVPTPAGPTPRQLMDRDGTVHPVVLVPSRKAQSRRSANRQEE